MRNRPEHREPIESIPDELIADLESLYGRSPEIPAAIDDAVCAEARGYLAPAHHRFMIVRWCAPLAAAAAVIVILLSVIDTGKFSVTEAPIPAAVSGDRVTVLDAFELARSIQSGHPHRGRWDMNHDGSVDGADVEVLMNATVRL